MAGGDPWDYLDSGAYLLDDRYADQIDEYYSSMWDASEMYTNSNYDRYEYPVDPEFTGNELDYGEIDWPVAP